MAAEDYDQADIKLLGLRQGVEARVRRAGICKIGKLLKLSRDDFMKRGLSTKQIKNVGDQLIERDIPEKLWVQFKPLFDSINEMIKKHEQSDLFS